MCVCMCMRTRWCNYLNVMSVVPLNRCTERKVQTTANVQTYVRRKHCMCESYRYNMQRIFHTCMFVPVYHVFMHDEADLS